MLRIRPARFVESLSAQFVHYISRTVQPCLHPLAIPTASLFATTNRTPTRLSAERTRRSGRSNLPFLLLVRAAAIATTWGCARSAGFDYWDRASSNGQLVWGTLSRGAHLVPGEEYAHFHRFQPTRATGDRFALPARVDPLRYTASRSLDREPKVDRAISEITARDFRSFARDTTMDFFFPCFVCSEC